MPYMPKSAIEVTPSPAGGYMPKSAVEVSQKPEQTFLQKLGNGARGIASFLAPETTKMITEGAVGNNPIQTADRPMSSIEKAVGFGLSVLPGGSTRTVRMEGDKAITEPLYLSNSQLGKSARELGTQIVTNEAINTAIPFLKKIAGKVTEPIGQTAQRATQSISGAIDNLAPKSKDVFNSVFTVPRKIASRMNMDLMGEKMSQYGVSGGLDDLSQISSKVTGQDGVLTRAVRDTLGKIKAPINIDDAYAAAEAAALDATNLDEGVAKKSLQKVMRMIKPQQGKGIGQNAAIDAWDTVRALEKEGYQLMGKSTDLSPNISVEQQGKIFLDAAEALKGQIDNANISSEAIESMKKKYYDQVVKINPKLAEEFLQAKNISDIRALAKPFVDLENAVEITKDNASSSFQKAFSDKGKTLGKFVRNPLNILAAPLDSPAVNTGAASMIAGNVPGKGIIQTFSKAADNAVSAAGKGARFAAQYGVINPTIRDVTQTSNP